MDGILTIHGHRQRTHAGYARIEGVAGLFISAFAAAWRGLKALDRARQMARVRREMHSLSDHFLSDIGMNRADIERIFR